MADKQRAVKQIARLDAAFEDLTIGIRQMAKNSKSVDSGRSAERWNAAIKSAIKSASDILLLRSEIEATLPKELPARPLRVVPVRKTGS